jgi:cell division protein ZapA (FtsZ GTPase activity inhibitor)
MNSISSNQPIHIEILGQSFTLKSDDSPEYIQGIVDELKQRYARISARMNVADPLRVAILAGLFLLDDFKKTQTPSLSSKSVPTGSVSGKPKNELAQSVSLDEEQIFARLDKRLGELGL